MKLKEFVNLTHNRANNQISFNLKARKLSQIGITPQYLLNLKLPKNSISKPLTNIIVKKEVKKNKIWKQ